MKISNNCHWISPQILKIELSEYPSIQDSELTLSSTNVQALDSACNYNKEDLIITIEKKHEIPKPSAAINAPDYYSISCSKQSLQISASHKSKIVNYAWNSLILPSNTQVSELISSSVSDTIDIPKSFLIDSVIKIELVVAYNNLNTRDTSSKEIIVQSKDYLTVGLNVKSFNQIKRNQAIYLVATIKHDCGKSENFSYKWTGSGINLNNYIQSNRKDMLQIPAGVLDSGKKYTFQVEVNEGLSKGKAATVYEVLFSDLKITLTRSSGEITT